MVKWFLSSMKSVPHLEFNPESFRTRHSARSAKPQTQGIILLPTVLARFPLWHARHPRQSAISQQRLYGGPAPAEQQLKHSLGCKRKEATSRREDCIDVQRVAHNEGQLLLWCLQVRLAPGCNHVLYPICTSFNTLRDDTHWDVSNTMGRSVCKTPVAVARADLSDRGLQCQLKTLS